MRLTLVLAAACVFAADAALANAWLKEKGQGELISSTTISQQRAGLSGGAAAQGYSGMHLEYGALERATLIADAGYQQLSFRGGTSTTFDTAYLGSRVQLRRWDNSSLSAEVLGGVSGIRESFRLGAPIAIQGTTITRIAFGDGFDLLGRHAFVGFDAGWRWRAGPPADELLFDATFGIEAWRTGLVMLQTFTILGIGPAGGAYRRYDLVKFQLSIAQRVSERWWLQLGALVTAAGTDSGNPGAVIGLWWRF